MKVIHKIPDIVRRIVPGTVGVLRFEHKVEIPLCYLPIFFIGKIDCGSRENKRPVCASIYDSLGVFLPGSIAATRSDRLRLHNPDSPQGHAAR